MGAKRGAKRAASGGTGKKRGRPSKKQKEEEQPQQEEEAKQMEEEEQGDKQQPTDSTAAAAAASNGGDGESTQHMDDSASKQSASDEAKTDAAEQTEKEAAAPSDKSADSSAAAEAAGGEKEGSKDSTKAELLEKGRLYFFYRPKVDAKDVKGPGDVQKFYILISPEGAEGRPAAEEEAEAKRKDEREAPAEATEGGKKHRLLVVSSKTLPGTQQRARNPWSFVDAVGSLEEVEHKLERYSYDTKTRGHREIEPARLCGEAKYELIKHGEDSKVQTHLVYELEVPEQPTDVQQAFNIQKEAQFLINVKNPDFNSAARSERPYAGFKPEAKAKIPEHLMEHFKGKRQAEVRYAPVMSSEFLDLPHAELVLIAVKKEVHDEPADFEKLVEQLEAEVEDEKGDETEKKVYEELKMDEKEHPSAVEEFK